jgi:hypothetical protein
MFCTCSARAAATVKQLCAQYHRCSIVCLLRCGVCVHELEDMYDDIIVWPNRAAA